jgi:hypothetical protein
VLIILAGVTAPVHVESKHIHHVLSGKLPVIGIHLLVQFIAIEDPDHIVQSLKMRETIEEHSTQFLVFVKVILASRSSTRILEEQEHGSCIGDHAIDKRDRGIFPERSQPKCSLSER